MNTLKPNDLKALHAQLGRPPRGVVSIETRCPVGHPQVIRVYPLLRKAGKVEPFPTLFWLACPGLIRQISALEHRGLISTLEQTLQDDANFRTAYHCNHRAYLNERWETLSEEDRHWVESQGWEAYFKKGIGGIANWAHIKCLHLQFAHYLARENVVGQWLDDHFSPSRCIC